LGTLRMLMNEYAPQLIGAIPHVADLPTIEQVLEKPIEPKVEPEKVKPIKERRDFWADQKK